MLKCSAWPWHAAPGLKLWLACLGFGDLTVTCSSELSRNYQLGLAIGRGETFDPTITVEGAATARAAAAKAIEMKIDMPITQTVTNLVGQRLTIAEAVAQLLARPLKEE